MEFQNNVTMKQLNIYIVLLSFSVQLFGQTLSTDQIYLADPTIFEDQGTYYLYGTKGDPRIEGEGFLVYRSNDLKNWEGPVGAKNGYALKKGDAFGTKGFWAPQVFKHQSVYYMAYTADEHIAIATSNHPEGPFTNAGKALKADVRQIDPYVFFENGKVYLYHVRLQDGNRIFVAEMTDDLQSIKPETLTACINAESGWEDTQGVEWPVAEGPTVFKQGKKYIMLYSANDFRNPDYAVGYAISDSPEGPWKKMKDSPIISNKLTNENGSGHGDLLHDQNGKSYYVFHTHFSDSVVAPRKTAIIRLKIKEKNIKTIKSSFEWLKL